jgi:hypothetical protein
VNCDSSQGDLSSLQFRLSCPFVLTTEQGGIHVNKKLPGRTEMVGKGRQELDEQSTMGVQMRNGFWNECASVLRATRNQCDQG